jgi:acyl carrier protein
MNSTAVEPRMSREEVAVVVKEAIIREAGLSVTPDVLTESVGLVSDIVQIDSMTFIRCLIGIEESLDSTFGDELLMQTGFKTVGGLIDRIYDAYAQAEAAR